MGYVQEPEPLPKKKRLMQSKEEVTKKDYLLAETLLQAAVSQVPWLI